MFNKIKFILFVFLLSFSSIAQKQNEPWVKFGLTDEEAARHVLDRFAFGPRQGDIEKVVSVGVSNWFEDQISITQDNSQLNEIFKKLDFKSLEMSLDEMANTYVPYGQINRRVKQWGIEAGLVTEQDFLTMTNEEQRRLALLYMDDFSLKPIAELDSETLAQKMLRAAYSENQFQEVLTDFWFNHFNIDASQNDVRPYVYSYERDAIRSNVFGNFSDMLVATAKHPGMLFYLDNGLSTAGSGVETTASFHMENLSKTSRKRDLPKSARNLLRNSGRGLNENYARELMELHTLGVDAFNKVNGYTQKDVQEVARAFTGWTWILQDSLNSRLPSDILPMGMSSQDSDMATMPNETSRSFLSSQLERLGFVQEGSFVFRASAHDAGEKNILGHHFPKGGGIDEGERVLEILSKHEYTARFLSKKIAIKFVQDNPPEELVELMSRAYLQSSGDLSEVYRAMFYSDYFWREEAIRSKIKSPFELIVSTVRILDSRVTSLKGIFNSIKTMGQPLYRHQAPTGYPDSASAWVNTGSLISRMNFGLLIGGDKIRGIESDLKALNTFNGVFHEPESVQHALEVYAGIIMPHRDLKETLRVLEPVVNAENLNTKIEIASEQFNTERSMGGGMNSDGFTNVLDQDFQIGDNRKTRKENEGVLGQIVGVILGSPEFQRR